MKMTAREKKILLLLLLCILLAMLTTGCTDAKRSKIFNLGASAEITCYSGERQIYQGRSTGKVASEETSDGYYFVDRADGRRKEVSGNCVIDYGK